MPSLIENTAAALTVAGGALGGVELLETVKNATGQVRGDSPFAPVALEVLNDMVHVQENLENMGFLDVSLVIAGLFILNRGTASLLSKETRPLAKIIGAGLFAVGAGATFLAPAVMETIKKGATAGGLEIAPFIALATVSFAGIQWLLQTIHNSNFSGEYSGRSDSDNTATPEELAARAIKNWKKENARLNARTQSKKPERTAIAETSTTTHIENKNRVEDILNWLSQRIEKRDQDKKDLDERRRSGR